jgi:cation transport protein ChaC
VADHEADLIDANLTRAQQIEYCATGIGFMGSSLDYLRNISSQFAVLGIQDDEVSELLRETESHINSRRTLPS